MTITPPESGTSFNANIQQSSATQLSVRFSRKCFRVNGALTQKSQSQSCKRQENTGVPDEHSDATGLTKRTEINTKTSLPREHGRVLEPQLRKLEQNEVKVWRTALGKPEVQQQAARGRKFNTMKKMATSDVCLEPRPCRAHVCAVARRYGNRGYTDFKVRDMWPWLFCEDGRLMTRHEQSLVWSFNVSNRQQVWVRLCVIHPHTSRPVSNWLYFLCTSNLM